MVLAQSLTPSVALWGIIMRSVIQFILLFICLVMLSRMISENPRVRLLTLLIFSFSFPVLILATITERRVITFIFLIFAVYRSTLRTKDENYWLSVASGAVICNAYVSLLSIKSAKTFIKDLFCFGSTFLFIAAFLGKISGLVDLRTQVNNFANNGWMDAAVDFKTKLIHYMNFVSSSFFTPLSESSGTSWSMAQNNGGYTVFFVTGIIIALLSVAGFILNFRERFARIAFTGILVSFFFVFVKTLNMSENAVVLNTLFFAWAFVSLCIMAIDRIIPGRKIKTCVLIIIAAACFAVNIYAAYRLLDFGMAVYPV